MKETRPPPTRSSGVEALGRDEAIEKLSDSEQQLGLLVESLADYAIFSLSLEGTITSWNAGGEALFGYESAEIIGCHFAKLFTPEERADGLPESQLAEATVHGSASIEFVLARKDDSRFRASGKINQLTRDCHGKSRGYVKIVRDISEQDAVFQHERAWSLAFQRAVLPVQLPQVPGLRFDALYEPASIDAQVGGDWYDAVRLLDGRVLVTIGDVAGRGLEAAVVVGVVRQIMRGIAQLHADPSLILDAADRALALEYPDIFVTAWVGILDLVTRTLTYSCAGHPPTLLVGADAFARELGDPGLPIGLRDGKRGASNTVTWSDRDTLVLYTDGLIEAKHDILEGSSLMAQAARALGPAEWANPAAQIKQLVIPDGSADDVAILVLRVDFQTYEQQLDRWQLHASDPVAATTMRRRFTSALSAQQFSADNIADAELVFGELIGNIVRHAGANDRAEIVLDHSGPRTVLHVLDQGAGFRYVSRLAPDPYSENGRGLFLIAAMTADFVVDQRPDGGSHARAVLPGSFSVTVSRSIGTAPSADERRNALARKDVTAPRCTKGERRAAGPGAYVGRRSGRSEWRRRVTAATHRVLHPKRKCRFVSVLRKQTIRPRQMTSTPPRPQGNTGIYGDQTIRQNKADLTD